MKSSLVRFASLVLGSLSIALGAFNWLWIFYASDAAHHMGSPIRRFPKRFVQSLTGENSHVAREAHGTGLVLIEVLGNTFWVLFLSGVVLILSGSALLYTARRQ